MLRNNLFISIRIDDPTLFNRQLNINNKNMESVSLKKAWVDNIKECTGVANSSNFVTEGSMQNYWPTFTNWSCTTKRRRMNVYL